MADLIARPIWSWVSKAWRSMEDLADKIDDLICTFEGGSDTTMDTIAMHMFGWMLIGLVVLGVGRYAYSRFILRTKDAKDKSDTSEPVAPVSKVENSVEGAKVAVKAVSGGGGGGKYVPPTPPVRKRLGSKSGRPAGPVKPGSSLHPPPPIPTGPESESVKWVSEMFQWLYSDLVIVNELLNGWIQSLNEFTKKSVAEHGVGVEFVRVLPETPAPNITNVFCECASNDDVTITCDCETTPALQVKAFRQRSEKVEVSHYRLNVNRFRARLNILVITEKLLADVKCDGWPEIKVSLAQVGAIKNNLDECQLQDVITEIVSSALRQTDVHFSLGQYPTCPRLVRQPLNTGFLLPLHYDSMLSCQSDKVSKRLLVKVMKANGLGSSQGCWEPYCVVEVDEPPQKNQTSTKKDTQSPLWEEHFLFDVSDHTSEVLLEVYDKRQGGAKFLGLGIVSMDELTTNPSQRQTISLQTAPYHEGLPVSGTLTVEFLLIEGAELPPTSDKPFKVKETLRSVSPSGQLITKTKTTLIHSPDGLTNGGDGITDSALKEIERSRGLQPNKSTLIIHSVQRTPQTSPQQVLKVEMTESGTFQEVPPHEPGANAPQPTSKTGDSLDNSENNERGRSRKKKRDFFGTLRRRLKVRSRSVGPGADGQEGFDPLARSISADRARDVSVQSGTLVQNGAILSPASNQHGSSYLSVPGMAGQEGSARSSLSEASGISGASSRTYVNEASTLVLETLENGIKKYYLVPLSLAQKNKWRKKGTKLHIFNDHTFIAKHLAGSTICEVCKKGLPRRLGKQGYQCRDCGLKCHKYCHVRADLTCPTSNIHNIELCSLAQSPFALRKLPSSPSSSR